MPNNIELDNAQFRMFTQFAASVKDWGTHLKVGANELVGINGAPRTIISKSTDF